MTLANSGMKRSMSCMNLMSLSGELACDQARDYDDFRVQSPLHVEYDLKQVSRKSKKTKKKRISLSTTNNSNSYNVVDPCVKECMKSEQELLSSWPTISLEESDSFTSCFPRSSERSISKKEENLPLSIPRATNTCFLPSVSNSSFESNYKISASSSSLNEVCLSTTEPWFNSQDIQPATIILDNQLEHGQKKAKKEENQCSCSHSLLTRLMEKRENSNCEADILVKPISPDESDEYLNYSSLFLDRFDPLQNNEPLVFLSTPSFSRNNTTHMFPSQIPLDENEIIYSFRTPPIQSVSPTCLRDELQLSRRSQIQKCDPSWTSDIHQITKEFSRIHVPL